MIWDILDFGGCCLLLVFVCGVLAVLGVGVRLGLRGTQELITEGHLQRVGPSGLQSVQVELGHPRIANLLNLCRRFGEPLAQQDSSPARVLRPRLQEGKLSLSPLL